MYICNNCEELFEDCKIIKEHHPYGMGYAVEEWAVCPYCSDADISEAKECTRCGAMVAELDGGLCECCDGELYGE